MPSHMDFGKIIHDEVAKWYVSPTTVMGGDTLNDYLLDLADVLTERLWDEMPEENDA